MKLRVMARKAWLAFLHQMPAIRDPQRARQRPLRGQRIAADPSRVTTSICD